MIEAWRRVLVLAPHVGNVPEEEVQILEQELRTWVRMQVALSIRARGNYLKRLQEHIQHVEQELDQPEKR